MTASGDALHLSADSESDTSAAVLSVRFARIVGSFGAAISGPGGPDAESYDEDLDEEEEGGEEMGTESLSLNSCACPSPVDAEAGPSGSRRDVTDTRGSSSPMPRATIVVVSDAANE